MSRFLVCVLPSSYWVDSPRGTPPTEDDLLRELLREAKALRERITSSVNLETERSRLTNVLGRVEATVLRRVNEVRTNWVESELRQQLHKGAWVAMELDNSYLVLLASLELMRASRCIPGISVPANPLSLGESIYHHDQLKAHLAHAEKEVTEVQDLSISVNAARERAKFIDIVARLGGYSLVEIQIVVDNSQRLIPPARRVQVPLVSESPADSPPDDEVIDGPRRQILVQRLHQSVEKSVAQFFVDGQGGKVNASNQPHEVSTDVLGEWFKHEGPPARVRIVYADGSEAAPFPLCAGVRPRPVGRPRTIRVALMSMRHLDIDRVVDLAWYRNREVSQSRSLAESDEFCFRYSLDELHKLAKLHRQLGCPIRLEVYHTGFEPASIALYRAVAAVLTTDASLQADWANEFPSPWLTVVPHYFKGGTHYQPSAARDGKSIEWF